MTGFKIDTVVMEIAFVDEPTGNVYYMLVNDTLDYLIDMDSDGVYSAELFSWKCDEHYAKEYDRELQAFFATERGRLMLANCGDAARSYGCFIRYTLPQAVGYPTMTPRNFMLEMPKEGMPWQVASD